jgi:Fur family zinc uptake transcriptional regulator
MLQDNATAMTAETPPAFRAHDHEACRAHAMGTAERVAAERGLRLTPVRARVLEILLESHRALGAYEVLERLAEEGAARQPPIAYRALDFLTENGLAHRVEALNAFVACACPGEAHGAVFLVCRPCGTVAELAEPEALAPLVARAGEAGFAVRRSMVELEGLCPDCQREGAA